MLAVSLPGALAAIGVALFGFAVVIAVSFLVLRLISFVTSGSDGDEDAPEPPTSTEGPSEPPA